MGAEDPASADPRREERALVERMLGGDQEAFDEFADGYFPGLYRFASARLDGNKELAREIAQTTVCKVLKKLEQYRGEAALLTWLCACCRNEIAMHFRRKRSSPQELELDEGFTVANTSPHASEVDGPENALIRQQAARMVHLALDLLPPHYAQALEWKYLDGLPVSQIAVRLRLGPKAAESLLTRARRAFREGYEHLTAGRELCASRPGTERG